jgi:two-component system chemotaxis response regulator CheB
VTTPIRVLVVDDSAFARKVIREVLDGHDGIEVVGIARDGLDALELTASLLPDVVTLDLAMPNLDGIGFLKALESAPKRPAVIIVSSSGHDTELGVAALELGAFDVVAKPTALATDKLYEVGAELRARVVAAARRTDRLVRVPAHVVRPKETPKATKTSLVLIGASTGGPQALTRILRALPGDFPVPIAMVLHMPEGYTDPFARRVDAESLLDVMEAREGLMLAPGRAILARAGLHLTFQATPDGWACSFDAAPMDTPHRPAVDVLFRSGAAMAKRGTLGVVLTGMGSDGVAGARAIRAAGGRVLTEAESSCVVYGMPRSVVEAKLSDAVAPIGSMVDLILENL